MSGISRIPFLPNFLTSLRFGSLVLLASGISIGQTVTAIENGASYIAQGLPNAGIAQGSIFVVMGTNLGPSPIVIDPVPFESTNLSGTSVSVTVGTTTVSAPMYYTSAAQVAA